MMRTKASNSKKLLWILLVLTCLNCYYWTGTIQSEMLLGDQRPDERRTTTTDSLQQLRTHRLLIAQFAAHLEGPYGILLNLTSPVNRAYADKWGFDYTILLGTPFDGSSSGAPDSRATYSKLVLLEKALESAQYDRILILDADALVYDFDRDINTLLPDSKLLLAHPTRDTNHTGTASLNIGVTMWNLHHEKLEDLLKSWKTACLSRIARGARDDDQAPLQQLLHEWPQEELDEAVEAPPDQLLYRRGVMVKHLIRPNGSSWNDVSVATRSTKILNATMQICALHNSLAFCKE